MSQLLLLWILLFRFTFNRRHMQGSFAIKTVKKLLICHCHRHLQHSPVRRATKQCENHSGKHEDWYIDCTMCFPCQTGKHFSENPISPRHTDTQWESQDAMEHLRCVAVNNLCCRINMSPVLYIPVLGSMATLACQRAHAEALSANTYLRYFPWV